MTNDFVFESVFDDLTQDNIDLALEDMKIEADDFDDKKKKKDEEVDEATLANAYLLDVASTDEIADIVSEDYNDIRVLSDVLGVAMEKTLIRMDKKARFKHLSKQAELNAAKNGNDPNYKKLMKIWAMERELEKRIHQRWGNKGAQVARVKIKDYAANGKRIAKPNPSTVSFKGKVSSKVATKAVAGAKGMFSKTNHTSPGGVKR